MEREFEHKKRVAFRIAGLSAALALINAVDIAHAAVLPGSVLPEQVTRSIEQQAPAPRAPVPQEIKEEKPQEQKAASEAAKKIKFRLNGLKLKGNKVYSTKELSRFYKKLLHKEITVADLFDVVKEITNYYRNNGYILSRAILPPQHVKGGLVTVEIVEGYIDKVEVAGKPYGARCLVKAIGSHVLASRPLALKEVEYALTISNEVPSTTVKAVLSPSKENPGAANLILNTTNTRLTGYFSYDNYGTRYIGPQQMTANLSMNSWLMSGDQTQVTFTKTPKGREMTFYDVNYNGALGSKGTRIRFGASKAQTNPLFVLRASKISGLNDNFYATVTIPLIRERIKTMNATIGLNYMDSNSQSFDIDLYTDHIRSLDFGIVFSNADKWLGSNTMSANFRQGLPLFGYTKDINPDTALTSRPGGHADYTKLSGSISRLQAIQGPISLYGLLRGQWAFNPLLSSEQFTFGGSSLGRGYDSAELIGDRGIAGSVELRYDLPVGKILSSLQLYAYYDFGEIWNLKTATGTPFNLSATSAGFGTRFYFNKYISGNLMWTQPLTKEVAAEELIGDGYRPRTWFSIVAAFL